MQLNALSSRAILRRCKPVAPLARKNEALNANPACAMRMTTNPGFCDP
jgi:hypothetical protein